MSKVLLQFATAVFFLNSLAAYGACCYGPSASDTDNTSAVVMPCHEPEEEGGSDEVSDCCLMCVPLTVPMGNDVLTPPEPFSMFVNATPAMVKSNIDPPFRPPISSLS